MDDAYYKYYSIYQLFSLIKVSSMKVKGVGRISHFGDQDKESVSHYIRTHATVVG